MAVGGSLLRVERMCGCCCNGDGSGSGGGWPARLLLRTAQRTQVQQRGFNGQRRDVAAVLALVAAANK